MYIMQQDPSQGNPFGGSPAIGWKEGSESRVGGSLAFI